MTELKAYRIPQLESGLREGSDAIFNSHSTPDILAALSSWGSERVLLVHSASLAAQTSNVADLKAALGATLVDAKSGVGAHSPYSDIIDIAHRITAHAVDALVCVGSGSYSDACKAARLLAATLPAGFGEAEVEALVDPAIGITPEERMARPAVRLILVPSSLSAGEWNSAASGTNSEGKKQHFARADDGAADLMLMDPWLARTAPRTLWLSSGVRAVDHCVETLCHRQCAAHPDAQEWCEAGLRALAKGLVEYDEGSRRGGAAGEAELVEGVSRCQYGSRMSLMGLLVYGIALGPSHAIGHQLGSVAGVMHGVTSCIMLPPVLRYTKRRNPDAQARVVRIFNEALGWSETEAADCVARLVRTLGLPSTLTEVGVTSVEQIEKIVDMTMTDAINKFGKIMEREEVAEIVYSAR